MRNNNEWREQFTERLIVFASSIFLLSNKLPKSAAGYALANQIVRSGSSIGANFVESQDASSTKDFIQKLSISLREARETLYWLKVIERTEILSYDEVRNAFKECDEIIAILVKSLKKVKKDTP